MKPELSERAEHFARHEYRDLVIYTELAKNERVPEFKHILEELIEHERGDYDFWIQYSKRKKFSVPQTEILFFKFVRNVLGLTFAAKFLEGLERQAVKEYSEFLSFVESEEMREEVTRMIEHEKGHEQSLISQIKEDRVRFLGNIVLGLNDGLIEISGALVGFALAFSNTTLVILSGVIVGLSASLSMASSAYQQSRYENKDDPKKAALFTGGAYIIVVFFLIAPFLIFHSIVVSLIAMGFVIALVVVALSFYSSVLFERPFVRQVTETALFSIGVAIVTFVIGVIARNFVPVDF